LAEKEKAIVVNPTGGANAARPAGTPLSDVSTLRELARRVAEIASSTDMSRRRAMWRDHNSLVKTRVPIYMRWFACAAEIIGPQLTCEDLFCRSHEKQLRSSIAHHTGRCGPATGG
jgi:hypothetical protein